ncbi:MAG: acyltransferase [Prevotella sp.]|nr:acyltransferase [Prevotella sp.]
MANKEWVTREECTAMKGIAILAIMLHNYCHWLKDIIRENEYTWLQWKCDRLWTVIQQPDEFLPMHLLSFFGHYGVPVFLFLSGFGLVMKYERGTLPEVGIWRFVRYNYLKLFRIMIVGFVLFTMLDAVTPGMHRYQASEVLAMLGMYANFLEHPSQVIWPGPYWYFGVTLQLYILYRLVFYRWRHWGIVVALIIGCWLWQMYCYDDMEMLERLRYNLVGGMLPFGMGVLIARFEPLIMKHVKVTSGLPLMLAYLLVLVVMIGGIFMFSVLSFDKWLWVPALIVIGTIALVKLIPNTIMPYILWLGGISAAIFVTHPLVRKIFVRPYLQDEMYAGLLLYVVATLVVSWLVKKIIDQIPSPRL